MYCEKHFKKTGRILVNIEKGGIFFKAIIVRAVLKKYFAATGMEFQPQGPVDYNFFTVCDSDLLYLPK